MSTVDNLPSSALSGAISLMDRMFECHVLTDGRRVLLADDVFQTLAGAPGTGIHFRRCFEILPQLRPGAMDEAIVRFRRPGSQLVDIGLEPRLVGAICETYFAVGRPLQLRINPGLPAGRTWSLVRAGFERE